MAGKCLIALLLFAGSLSQMTSAFAQEDGYSPYSYSTTIYPLNNPRDSACELKRWDESNGYWLNATESELGDEPINIERSYSSGRVGFRIKGRWYSCLRACIDNIGTGKGEGHGGHAPNASSLDHPDYVEPSNSSSASSSSEPWRKYLVLSYRMSEAALVDPSITVALSEKWIGVAFGFEHDGHLSRSLLFHTQFDLGVGMISLTQEDDAGGNTFEFSSTFGFSGRGAVGIGFPLGASSALYLDGGLNATYASLGVPDGFDPISATHFGWTLGLGLEFKMGNTSRLKFETGMQEHPGWLYLEAGLTF